MAPMFDSLFRKSRPTLAFVLTLAALMFVTFGMVGQLSAQQFDIPFIGPPEPTEPSSGDASGEGASGGDASGGSSEESTAFNAPGIDVPSVEPGLARARQLLAENYADFLVRESLHFDLSLADHLVTDAYALWDGVNELRSDLSQLDPWTLVDWAVPILIVLIFVVLFILLDRQAQRVARRTQLIVHADLSPWVTSLLRSLVLMLGRAAAIALLVALSYFPIQATFSSEAWTRVLTGSLWWLLVYRVAHAMIVTSLRLSPVDPGATAHYLRLERFAIVTLRVSLGFLLLLTALFHFEYRADAIGFVAFVFRLTLALAPIYLFFARDAVLALLPVQQRSPLYGVIRRSLSANYYGMLGVTITLLLFNAAGFVHAATFILARGYTLIVLLTLSFSAAERLRAYVARKSEEAQEEMEGHEDASASFLLRAIEQWTLA